MSRGALPSFVYSVSYRFPTAMYVVHGVVCTYACGRAIIPGDPDLDDCVRGTRLRKTFEDAISILNVSL